MATKEYLQDIFSRAVSGVVNQGALSQTGAHASCRYRIEADGKTLRCGVGQLIADDLYSPLFEDVGVSVATPEKVFDDRSERLMLALTFSGVDVTDPEVVDLLYCIQRAHDGADSLAQFQERASSVAQRFGLGEQQ